MSLAYNLKADNEFISPDGGENVFVYLYDGDFNLFLPSSSTSNKWASWVGVGPTATRYGALEVFGTRIEGDKFKELCDELKAIEKGGLSIFVNRLGQCMIHGVDLAHLSSLRIKDHFGWSKYGVKLPRETASFTVWDNVYDMYTGETLMDVHGIVGSGDELRRSLEERNVELAACTKELVECKEEMERSKEVEEAIKELRRSLEKKAVELKDCKEELKRSKEESVLLIMKLEGATKELRRSLEEKTVELTACKEELERSKKESGALIKKAEVVNNLTFVFSNALRYLDGH